MSEKKENIIKISVSAALLIVALVLTKAIFTTLPFWANLLIFLPSYLTVGYDVLSEAIEKLLKGRLLAEDFLMSIATVGAIAMGDFSEAIFVMLFYTVGEIFEESAEEKSEKAIKDMLSICSDNATVLRDNKELSVEAKTVAIGETVIIKAGERIPIDGVVIEGSTKIDSSSVTGESVPKTVNSGQNVYSGTLNINGLIKVKTTKTFENSTASKMLELIKNATEKKAKTERFITKFATVYTPVVVVSAILFAVIPSILFGNTKEHIYSALTFLVVSCPCALVVSIPVSFFGAVGNASKNGILVKGSVALETFSKVKAMAFDKTGTLTKGTFGVTAVHPQIIDETELLRIAASCEKNSNHPIALSIVKHFGSNKMLDVTDFSEISGKGIICKTDNKKVLIGNESLMEENGVEYKKCHHIGTVVHIAVDGIYAGHIVISDEIKPGATETIAELKKIGIKTVMLTGDNNDIASSVAKKVDVDEYKSSLLPIDKVNEIENLIVNQKLITAFSGDGINDAPVLARADIGIAMGALGSDAAVNSADIVIMNDDIRKLPKLIILSKKAVRIAKQNVVFSIGVKLSVLIISAFSIPHIMWVAAFADVGVLILAVLNSMRTMKD